MRSTLHLGALATALSIAACAGMFAPRQSTPDPDEIAMQDQARYRQQQIADEEASSAPHNCQPGSFWAGTAECEDAGPPRTAARLDAAATDGGVDSAAMDREAQSQAAWRRISEHETAAGQCSTQRYAQMQQGLRELTQLYESPNLLDNGDQLQLADSFIGVAKPDGGAGSVETIGGEYHVYVVGFDQFTIDVTNERGQPQLVTSPYEVLVRGRVEHSESRIVQTNASGNARLDIRVRGVGCALVLVFHRI